MSIREKYSCRHIWSDCVCIKCGASKEEAEKIEEFMRNESPAVNKQGSTFIRIEVAD